MQFRVSVMKGCVQGDDLHRHYSKMKEYAIKHENTEN